MMGGVKDEEEEEPQPLLAIVLVAILFLVALVIFESFEGQFLFKSTERERGKHSPRTFCMCCDVWPLKYIKYFKKND